MKNRAVLLYKDNGIDYHSLQRVLVKHSELLQIEVQRVTDPFETVHLYRREVL